MKAVNVADKINYGNREEERELAVLLAPIDRRLTVTIFNKGMFDCEVAVGRNGQVTHQPSARFRFGFHPRTFFPYVMDEEFCIGFDEDFGIAMEWLRQTVAKVAWNYFYRHPDRVQATVNPLGKAD
ncbi:MAG: hypothetical protein LBC94_03820 [Desulfovibrio sp.]|jgi:hypothetical protein|nr:hypothetical protein [Desulfovibrio sp.]